MSKPNSPSPFPSDWPKAGMIDLSIHDLPHASSSLEWWYLNSHFVSESGKSYSVFASFFRKLIEYKEESKELVYAHSLIWAVYEEETKKYRTFSLVDPRAPKLAKEKLEQGLIVKDARLRRAALEVVCKGNVPLPDRLLQKEAVVRSDILHLDFDGNIFSKNKDESYQLNLWDEASKIGCNLRLTLQKPVIRHGNEGVVKGNSAEDMFYYFCPSCEVTGTVTLQGDQEKIKKGKGWYDHEFGRPPEGEENHDRTHTVSWNWVAIQLDNGCEVSAYEVYNDEAGPEELPDRGLVFVDQQGKRFFFDEFTLAPSKRWTSTKTFKEYPTQWHLSVPDLKLELEIVAAIEAQEFITFISRPAFWEGKVNITGKYAGQEVSGPGFFERSGFDKMETLDDFFKSVGKTTLRSVRKILPLDPKASAITELISGQGHERFLEGFDKNKYVEAVIKPIREVIDRGGKSWRSYATLACCDIVGGDSQPSIEWLALPELMHSGSLIVDDVEDQSEIRRGKPAIHKLYGDAIAINAGTACYFLSQICIYHGDLDDSKKLEIYKYYFEGLRAAHAGQALDISGLHYMMPEIVENGDGALLEKRVLSIHRLKSAVPASFLARMGAVLGNGTEAQIKGLEDYFEAIGLAFQMIDDTLNLKGFEKNLKSKGEDIAHGKVTYPVAKAMRLLPKKEDRQQLWSLLQQKSTDITVIAQAIRLIEDCGALTQSEEEAKEMVEAAWHKLDPLVEDSLVKMMLRAFSWYVLDRQY